MQTIRTSLLDLREKAYERSGQGSSYLFRVDENWAVDATRQVRFLTAQTVTKQIQDVLLRLAPTDCSCCKDEYLGVQAMNMMVSVSRPLKATQ